MRELVEPETSHKKNGVPQLANVDAVADDDLPF
jgi:hypothetical protein